MISRRKLPTPWVCERVGASESAAGLSDCDKGFTEMSWDRATKTGSHSYDREETRKKEERQSWPLVRWKSWIWKKTIGKKYCWVRGTVGGNWVRKIVGEQYDLFRGSKYCNYPN